jgi:hypothetical protein
MEGRMTAVDFAAGALPYAEQLGWKVLLLGPGSKLPHISKGRGGRGVHDASSDAAQIRAWGKLCPHGNIGLACGAVSGVLAVDVDPRNGGDKSLAVLAANGRVLPPCPRQRTGNHGWHYLFKADPRIGCSKGRLGPGIEIKSTGGYILVAPSWTAKSDGGPGGPYTWEVSPFDMPAPRMPIWLQTMLLPPPPPATAIAKNARGGDIEPLVRFVASSSKGERNKRLYWAACRARELVERRAFSGTLAIRRLTEAAAVAGLMGYEVIGTIKSGLEGAPAPRGSHGR